MRKAGRLFSVVRVENVLLAVTRYNFCRYLINDACAHLRIPLVSGSALRWEGQLTVYNSQTPPGPCYRCLFPQPPALNNAGACDMQGVIGPAPGIIGTLQVKCSILSTEAFGEITRIVSFCFRHLKRSKYV